MNENPFSDNSEKVMEVFTLSSREAVVKIRSPDNSIFQRKDGANYQTYYGRQLLV